MSKFDAFLQNIVGAVDPVKPKPIEQAMIGHMTGPPAWMISHMWPG